MKTETDAIDFLEGYLSRKRIAVDLDGVICRYDFPTLVKYFFGVELEQDSIYAYDLADVLGVAPAQIDAMFAGQVWGKPTFVDGALETLQEWEHDYEIVIVSNRVKYMGEAGLAEWLINYEIPFDGIDAAGTMKYDYMIDDSPAKLMATDSDVKLLYSQSWNLHCKNILGALRRVNSWAEIREIIK